MFSSDHLQLTRILENQPELFVHSSILADRRPKGARVMDIKDRRAGHGIEASLVHSFVTVLPFAFGKGMQLLGSIARGTSHKLPVFGEQIEPF